MMAFLAFFSLFLTSRKYGDSGMKSMTATRRTGNPAMASQESTRVRVMRGCWYWVLLLTQPSWLGHGFNPVSFWFALKGEELIAVIAEVNNTYGDRHSYFCARADLGPIDPQDRICVQKLLHVSPFQSVAGAYEFRFHLTAQKVAIRIDFRNEDNGLVATLAGPRAPLTNRVILRAVLRNPVRAFRVTALIHWQALRLKLRGALFRARPAPPKQEVS